MPDGTSHSPDLELIAQVLAGHRESFAPLVVRHLHSVQAYLRGFGHPPDRLDDLLQETFLRAFRYLASYQTSRPFLGWLLGIARNLSRDLNKPTYILTEMQILSERPSTGPAVEDTALAGVEVEALLAPLTEADRLLIELRIFQGLSYREIGELVDQTEPHVRVRFHRILARLRAIVRERRRLASHD